MARRVPPLWALPEPSPQPLGYAMCLSTGSVMKFRVGRNLRDWPPRVVPQPILSSHHALAMSPLNSSLTLWVTSRGRKHTLSWDSHSIFGQPQSLQSASLYRAETCLPEIFLPISSVPPLAPERVTPSYIYISPSNIGGHQLCSPTPP